MNRPCSTHQLLHPLMSCTKSNGSTINTTDEHVERSSLRFLASRLYQALSVQSTEVNHADSPSYLLTELARKKIKPLTALLRPVKGRTFGQLGNELQRSFALNSPVKAVFLRQLLEQFFISRFGGQDLAVDQRRKHRSVCRSSFFIAFFQLTCKLMGSASGPIRRLRNQPHRQSSGTCDNHCSPISQIPPVRGKRTYLDCHNPSLLEPILP